MTTNIFRVALTGGIASGKTTVAEMFRTLGATLIDTDTIAREVVAADSTGLRQVVSEFGEAVLLSDGTLDRRALRQVVFDDKEKRQQLEAILHPLIRKETEQQMLICDGDYQIIIVPLLVGSPLQERVNRTLVVDCDEDIQLRRLLDRDSEAEAQARRMIAAQAGRADRLALADDIILNNGDISETQDQVDALHRRYLSFAASRKI